MAKLKLYKNEKGEKLYPVGSFQKNQHKFEYWYTKHKLNGMIILNMIYHLLMRLENVLFTIFLMALFMRLIDFTTR